MVQYVRGDAHTRRAPSLRFYLRYRGSDMNLSGLTALLRGRRPYEQVIHRLDGGAVVTPLASIGMSGLDSAQPLVLSALPSGPRRPILVVVPTEARPPAVPAPVRQ